MLAVQEVNSGLNVYAIVCPIVAVLLLFALFLMGRIMHQRRRREREIIENFNFVTRSSGVIRNPNFVEQI